MLRRSVTYWTSSRSDIRFMDSSECYVQSTDSRNTLVPGVCIKYIKYKLSTSVRVLKNCARIVQVWFEEVNTDGAPDIPLMMWWRGVLYPSTSWHLQERTWTNFLPFLVGCALTFASEAKFEIEAKISFRLEAKKKPDFTFFTSMQNTKNLKRKRR